MQIHRVRGSSLKDALMRARRAHGEDAVVISHEVVAGGDVALAISRRRPERSVPNSQSSASAQDALSASGRLLPGAHSVAPAHGAPLAVARPVPGSHFSSSAGDVRFAVARPEEEKYVPGTVFAREIAQCLARSGASVAFIERIAAEVESQRASGRHALDIAADAIGALFPPARLAKVKGAARIVAFVGANGAGKTTCITKLALRMKRAGRRVELATLDARRAGGLKAQRSGPIELLRAHARELQVPVTVMRPSVRLARGAFESSRVDAVLLDTSGDIERDAEEIARLRESFAKAPITFDVHAVFAASSSRGALAAIAARVAILRPSGAIVTKLDETREPAAALEQALALGAALAFFSDGPAIERHFERASADSIADLFLRGRLA